MIHILKTKNILKYIESSLERGPYNLLTHQQHLLKYSELFFFPSFLFKYFIQMIIRFVPALLAGVYTLRFHYNIFSIVQVRKLIALKSLNQNSHKIDLSQSFLYEDGLFTLANGCLSCLHFST